MAWRERDIIRLLHLVLSIPILGFLYGPVAHIARAAWFTRWVAFPAVVLSGLWLWLKPKVMQRLSKRAPRPVVQLQRTATAGSARNPRGASVAHAYGRK
jgi:hypothetical protein